jgi:hypothetical protein
MADFMMIRGTGGQLDYLAFAYKGNHALGVKPLPIAPGHILGVPDTLYFGARVRGVVAGDLFAGQQDNIVPFSKAESPSEEWPDVPWEKIGQTFDGKPYCSIQIGMFIKAAPSMVAALEGQIAGSKLAKQMTDYLVTLAGADYMVLSGEELSSWLHGKYKTMVDKIYMSIAKHKEAADALTGTIGTFEAHAAMLKKIFQQNGPKQVEKPADNGD